MWNNSLKSLLYESSADVIYSFIWSNDDFEFNVSFEPPAWQVRMWHLRLAAKRVNYRHMDQE